MAHFARVRLALAVTGLAVLVPPWTNATNAVHADPRAQCVVRAALDGAITSPTARHIASAARMARARSCALLVVVDTPGGLLDATTDIVRTFLDSPAPVIVFVGGEGARAASAGALVTMAGHVTAMAPSAHLGAAHPISMLETDRSSVVEQKRVNDVAAFARAIAERRGRNVTIAERMVRESTALTATEAQSDGVVDLVVANERALLSAIDGRTVMTSSGPVTLALRGAAITEAPMGVADRALHALGNPSLAYALVLFGMFGIAIEIATPHLGIAGFLGGLALVLGLLGLSALPVGTGGVMLLVSGIALLASEAVVVSHGVLGMLGIGCLVFGALLLVDPNAPGFWFASDFRVGWATIVPTATTLGLAFLLLVRKARRVARTPSVTGVEGLVGQVGRVTRRVDARSGEASVLGERWQVVADVPIDEGDSVRVVDVHGLRLDVVPTRAAEAQSKEARP